MDEIAPKIVAGERRLSMLLMGYWRETRADRRAPLERALKRAVPPDLFADCFVYLPARKHEADRLHDIGENIARASGLATTSLARADAPRDTLIAIASKWLDKALTGGAPIIDDGRFKDSHGNRVIYRAILLPLADRSGGIVQILGGARCKASGHENTDMA